tara:strand:- start:25979 stop:26545 length:567 start_codon:yes stop_codon:yes gene_type:complete
VGTTSDIRNGAVIHHKGKRWKVIEFQHVKPGKGGAFVRTKLKDLQTGKGIDETFNAGARLDFIRIESKAMQYLYVDDTDAYFMDNQTYDQIQVNLDLLGNNRFYLISGMDVDLLFDGEEVLDVRLPSHVILTVTKTEPGFKGNTATGASKPATLETGVNINVPLFINEGDSLKIDTRSGEYIERAKQN